MMCGIIDRYGESQTKSIVYVSTNLSMSKYIIFNNLAMHIKWSTAIVWKNEIHWSTILFSLNAVVGLMMGGWSTLIHSAHFFCGVVMDLTRNHQYISVCVCCSYLNTDVYENSRRTLYHQKSTPHIPNYLKELHSQELETNLMTNKDAIQIFLQNMRR